MSYRLIVTAPFASFPRGALISDPTVIAAVEKDHHDKVVKIPAPVVKAKE